MIYYAQGRDAVYVKVKLSEDMDGEGCTQSFSKQMDVKDNDLKISVICFENENDVKKFEKTIKFANEVDVMDIVTKEEGDAVIEFRVPKTGG